MKKTKKLVAMVVAVLMILSVTSIAMAAPGDNNTNTDVKVEVKAPVEKQISATVPLEFAISLQKTGTSTGNVTVPTNYAITNTSKDATAPQIRVTGISAASPVGSKWSLSGDTAATADKQLKLGLGATPAYFPALGAGASGSVFLKTIPTELTNIAGDTSIVIPIAAQATFGAGVNATAAASALAYKIAFTIAPQAVEALNVTAVTAPGTITVDPASPATAGNKYVYHVQATAITPPAIGDTLTIADASTNWAPTSGASGLTSGNHIVVVEVTADNRVVKTSVDKTIS
ncbi:MAG: hypothetical protein RR632_03760 [Christensenella sp.]